MNCFYVSIQITLFWKTSIRYITNEWLFPSRTYTRTSILMPIETDLWCKACITNITFEGFYPLWAVLCVLLSFMNWCQIFTHLPFLCEACITNITIERPFLHELILVQAADEKSLNLSMTKCYRSIHVPLSHDGSTLKTFCFKQKLKLFQKTDDLENLLFYQQNWRFSWTEGNTNENLPFSKINKMWA